MKIGLNMSGSADPNASKAAEGRAFEHVILNAKKGDWEAKDILQKKFTPLITSLAEKRAKDQATINKLIESGKLGLLEAANRYKPSIGPDKFRIFALDFIEAEMDSAGRSGGFFARLFGKK